MADRSGLLAAIEAVRSRPNGPIRILNQLRLEYDEAATEYDDDKLESEVWDFMKSAPQNHDVIQRFGLMLRTFDATGTIEPWCEKTANNSEERRGLIYKKLGLPTEVAARLDSELPFMEVERPILIAEDHEKWYTSERKGSTGIYWQNLKKVLREQWNDDENLGLLDRASDEIVGRLSDPLRKEVHAVRGLVVGYVQSGKTANFTSVIAKAIDAGYRLVIVLAGQWDILREQTQRRIDKELCGKENIMRKAPGGVHDYADDKEWPDFVSHGGDPSDFGGSDIVRLTTASSDYKSLAQGIDTLEFNDGQYSDRNFNIPANLFSSTTKLVVMKKHVSILDRLIEDLERLSSTNLSEVPVLIIDDESDQASVNTKKPTTNEVQERTAINHRLVRLLSLFPRGQYVGYTATPFANVFVDPTDQEDIYPRHFIYALERPIEHYMGVRDFFDVDDDGIVLETDNLPKGYKSNQRSYIRTFVEGKNDDKRLKHAILMFVLTGAVKLFREERNEIKARHHTMLVHRSHKIVDHAADRNLVQKMWDKLEFGTDEPHEALEELFEQEIQPVSAEKGAHLSLPDTYEELRPYVGKCIRKVESQERYIRVINGSKQYMEDAPAFETKSVWSILVGGTKLSRGYTVEGLTISYFMRRSQQVDTLMQMGRWFGFRKGYRDLVRVYLQAGSTEKKRNMNLVAAFRAACMDEEALRAKLAIYKEEEIKPIDVAPVVQAHMLMPTAVNKRYNATIKNTNLGGRWKYTTLSDRKYRKVNTEAFRALMAGRKLRQDLLSVSSPDGSKDMRLECMSAQLGPQELLEFIREYKWPNEFKGFEEVLIYLRGTGEWDPEIDQWLLLMPQVAAERPLINLADGCWVKCVERTFLDERRFDAVTDPMHRKIAEFLAHVNLKRWSGNIVDNAQTQRTVELCQDRQGIFLCYPVLEKRDGGYSGPING